MQVLQDNAELLLLVRAKSRAGAEALYDQYAKVLRLCIFRIVRDCHLTEELLEKTIVRIWDSAALFNEQECTLLAWMLGIAREIARETLQLHLVA